jgi:hypothetical protein
MVRVFFPSMFMRLISWKPNKAPPQALLHVPPAMTKHEITEYLTKIYDVDVTKVMTANFLGEFSYSSCAVVLSDGLWPFVHPSTRQVEEILWKAKNIVLQAKELQNSACVL